MKISWPVPEKPNGIIVSYTIRYQRVDLEHSKGQDICITHRLYQNLSGEYHLKHLENGNYSFMVMATSLAGPGKWSPTVHYLVDVSFELILFSEFSELGQHLRLDFQSINLEVQVRGVLNKVSSRNLLLTCDLSEVITTIYP